MPHDGGMMIRTPDPISCPARHAAVTCQPVTCQPAMCRPGTCQPAMCRPAISGPPSLGGHLPRSLLSMSLLSMPLLSMLLLAMLLLTSLAGCAMTGDDRMALATGEQSATPHSAMIESDDNTITFEFGVGMTGPTRVVAVTSSSSIPATAMMMPILNIWRGRKSPNGGRRSKVSGCHHRSLKRVDARRGASRNPVPIRVQVALARPRRTGLKIRASHRRNRPRAPT